MSSDLVAASAHKAMGFEEVAPGILMARPFGPYRNACWLLYSGREAAVVEAPPYSEGETPPWEVLGDELQERGLKLRYAFLSHGHLDHCQSLPKFRRRFPFTRFVVHQRLAGVRSIRWLAAVNGFTVERNSAHSLWFFDELFSGDLWEGFLGREPLWLIYAPKHSWSDHMIVFKGAMLTGDWYLGDLKDCNAEVPVLDKLASIDRVVEIITKKRYWVHMLFSAHGDHLFYGIDFKKVMETTKIDHGPLVT